MSTKTKNSFPKLAPLLAKRVLGFGLAIVLISIQLITLPNILAETVSVANPIFFQNCGLDIVLVLDNSTSIDEDGINQEKNAFLALVDDLSGTPYGVFCG